MFENILKDIIVMLLMIPAATSLLTLERQSRELNGGWWRRDQSAGQDVLLQLQEQLVPGGQQIISIHNMFNIELSKVTKL